MFELPHFGFFADTLFGQIIVQAIGIVAMALTILCYQLKRRSHILLMQYTGNALWVAHYFLLGSSTGLIINALNVVRGIIYASDKKWTKSYIWTVLLCIAAVALGVLSFSAWYSVLPIVANVISNIALRIKDENTLRKVYITSVPPWIVYNGIVGSIPGVISASFTFVSIVVALIRYNGFKKRERGAGSEYADGNVKADRDNK